MRAQCYVMCDRANVTLYACITVFAGFKQTLNRTTVGALHSVEEDPGTLARWKEYFTALLEGLRKLSQSLVHPVRLCHTLDWLCVGSLDRHPPNSWNRKKVVTGS